MRSFKLLALEGKLAIFLVWPRQAICFSLVFAHEAVRGFVGFTLEGSLKFGGFYLGRVVLQVRSAFPQAQCAGFAQDGC